MKKAATVMLVCGMMTMTACKLNMGDRSVDMPWWVLTIMVVLPSLLIAAVIVWFTVSDNARSIYVCPHCGGRFKAGWRVLYTPHIDDMYAFKCPHCGKRDFCNMSYDQDE